MGDIKTCNACDVVFNDDSESHRAHYKTDWHRYNLRRRAVDLSPMLFEDFQERRAAGAFCFTLRSLT